MENPTKKNIVKQIEAYQASKELSQNALAKDINISPAQLINVINPDKWENVSEKMWNKLKARFAPGDVDWKLFATYNYNLLSALVTDAKANHRLLACSAASGFGKTTTLKQYSNETPNAFYVLTHSVMTQRDFLVAVLRAMGHNEEGTMSKMVKIIVDKLNGMHNPIVILDDYGKACDSIYRITQLLYDLTEGNCGFVIAGTTYLKDYVYTQAARNKRGFREFKRRVEYWLGLHRPSKKIVTQICEHHSIKNTEVINYIHKHSDDYGTLKALITNAKRATDNGVDMDIITAVKVGDLDYEDSI